MTVVDDDVLEQVSTVVAQVFDEQAPIEVARGLAEDAAGTDEGLWRTLGELGFLGLEVGDADGDGALGMAGLAIVLREAGRTLAPVPLLSSVVLGAGILRTAGSPSQRGDWLTGIGSGTRRLTVGFGQGVVRDGEVLVGTIRGVLDGGTADALVVEVGGPDGSELWLLPRDTAGLTTEARATYDQTRRLTDVHLAGVRTRDVEPLVAHDPTAVIAWSIDRAATALAIDSAAGGRAAMELAVAYAMEREQFGRPIGSFQAIKHHCANMLVGVETSRVAAAAALREMPTEPGAHSHWASIAKAHATDAHAEIAGLAIYVHGGIGFTWDHDLHLHLKRAKLNQALFGTAAWHREQTARHLLDGRGSDG